MAKGKEKNVKKEIYRQYMYSYPHKTAYRALKDVDIREYLPRLKQGENSLYFHIPFCQAKCGYCNLFSVVGKGTAYVDAYLNAMERQIQQYDLYSYSFSDVTIGGGTPLYLEEKQLIRLFQMIETVQQKTEYPVIIETSPNQTTEGKLTIIKAGGTQRISLGIQSFHEEELKKLYRIHTPKQARNAIKCIEKQQFACVNFDFIYGIPGQTVQSLEATLEEGVSYGPQELFIYPLYIKNGTLLKERQEKREENTRKLYDFVCEYLNKKGYVQYSMRRFVRKDYVPLTPALECGFGNTLSIGCGGRSYLGNLHFCTPYYVKQKECNAQLERYLATEDYRKITHGFLLDKEEEKRRYVIKNILFISGLNRERYRQEFGEDVEKEFEILKLWREKGYLKEDKNTYVLTKAGMALSDYLGPQLISSKVKGRMKEWENKFFTEGI